MYTIANGSIPDPMPAQSAFSGTDGTDTAFLVGPAGFTDWDLVGSIVGSWDSITGLQEGQTFDSAEPPNVVGVPLHPVTADYTGWIRPLGNKSGRATGPLDSIRWQGDVEQKYLDDADRYPVDVHPFTLQVTREDNTYADWDSGTTYAVAEKVMHAGTGWQSQQSGNTNREPGQPGSGPWWLATEFGFGWNCVVLPPLDTNRDIQNRKVTVYTEIECINVLYSTGAFVQNGGPWKTSAPSGNWTPAPDAVFFALTTVGNVQEGCWSLDVGQDETTAEFWAADMS